MEVKIRSLNSHEKEAIAIALNRLIDSEGKALGTLGWSAEVILRDMLDGLLWMQALG